MNVWERALQPWQLQWQHRLSLRSSAKNAFPPNPKVCQLLPTVTPAAVAGPSATGERGDFHLHTSEIETTSRNTDTAIGDNLLITGAATEGKPFIHKGHILIGSQRSQASGWMASLGGDEVRR